MHQTEICIYCMHFGYLKTAEWDIGINMIPDSVCARRGCRFMRSSKLSGCLCIAIDF